MITLELQAKVVHGVAGVWIRGLLALRNHSSTTSNKDQCQLVG